MKNKYTEYKNFELPEIEKEIISFWEKQSVFEKTVSNKKEKFIFYEGPPSANGTPGIHHVMARTIKDLFCRFWSMKGFSVDRKAGWDTHGLPVELSVEKKLNITKEDIGDKISIEKYNQECRKDVMRYKKEWENLTKKMGYWVNMKNPYITYENKYIETVWWLLKKLFEKKLLYKGYTVQPFSPCAGTGLSTHELNQPGCYKNVKDTSVTAQFEIIKDKNSEFIFNNNNVYFIAWTTTPWTLPSNTALALGEKINYVKIKTQNPYSKETVEVIMARDLIDNYFSNKSEYKIMQTYLGHELLNLKYKQLMPYAKPKKGDAFKTIHGDFVSTESGTGIVHVAPSFGSDDMIIAKKNNIGSLTLVDKYGRFTKEVVDFENEYVKKEYDSKQTESVDVRIAVKLKKEKKAFKIEKYEHSYPHCWRTDKPILYYPLDSWFVKTTAVKEKLIKLNEKINWHPKSTGEGRFKNWLQNLVDWNLSRSRFWGTPLPIWMSENKKETKCIGSIEELKKEIEKSIKTGFMKKNPLVDFKPNDFSKENYNIFDLHKPFVDNIILVSEKGEKMFREQDLIDVWFDSGAMPFAQHHYPFENQKEFNTNFPADFIAEGVDQTRGWFFTLHVISSMLFDSIAYKNVLSNGLVLDKNGNKMSKRLNNAVDPFDTLADHGADATRWYMISNSPPWDNIKFDEEGIKETKRKFFGTLYNTYSFFALYANIDNYKFENNLNSFKSFNILDKWIISRLNSLIKTCENNYKSYNPTPITRDIQNFVVNDLSNWYVRLSRRRFWKGELTDDKKNAYFSIIYCLENVAKLAAPIAPFFMDKLYQDVTQNNTSVHCSKFPDHNDSFIIKELEEEMYLAQKICSLTLALRKKEKIRVRQPLKKITIPVLNEDQKNKIINVKDLILSETNIKNIEFVEDDSKIFHKKIFPNYKILGPKIGENIKEVATCLSNLKSSEISEFEKSGEINFKIKEKNYKIKIDETEIKTKAVQGFSVMSNNETTVALDIEINNSLKEEGLARELINKIQNIRKENKLDVVDRIKVYFNGSPSLVSCINNNLNYICEEILANDIELEKQVDSSFDKIIIINEFEFFVKIKKDEIK